MLRNASHLNFALQPDIHLSESETNANLNIYLQLGINAENQMSGEDVNTIPCWKIENLDLNSNEWQTMTIFLDDIDRAKLAAHTDARLIVTGNIESGTIYFGPYEPVQLNLKTYHDESILVSSTVIADSPKDFTDVITWHIPAGTDISTLENSSISSVTYFSQIDFSTYGNLEFDFGVDGYNLENYLSSEDSYGFKMVLEASNYPMNSHISDNHGILLEIKDLSPYFSSYPVTHKLTINLKENKVFIDQLELKKDDYFLIINNNAKPDRMTITVNTIQNSNIYTLYP